jgi:hypothetical protein
VCNLIIIFPKKFMAKVNGPLMSMDASGTIGDALTFAKWKGRNYVRQYTVPTYSNTTEQAKIRDIFRDASLAWKAGSTVGGVAIDSAYKLAYGTAASPYSISGFNLFIKECVQKNAGVAYDGSLAVPSEPGDIA